jgi:hypothetical protein
MVLLHKGALLVCGDIAIIMPRAWLLLPATAGGPGDAAVAMVKGLMPHQTFWPCLHQALTCMAWARSRDVPP